MADNRSIKLRSDAPQPNAPRTGTQDGRLPDFILVGAMKSGTTSLFQLLQQHPQIFMCTPKEPQFFSREHVYARGEQWYRSLFTGAQENQICGEASTCYSRWPHFGDVPARIARHAPHVRFLYMMRHPVDRAYSHYGHLMQERLMWKREPVISFEEALESIEEIIDTSLYVEQIEQYLRCFERERFLFLTLDDLKEARARTLEQVLEFVGVKPADCPAQGEVVANPWGEQAARYRLRTLVDKTRRAPGLSRVMDHIPKSLRSKTKRLITQSPMAISLMRLTVLREKRRMTPLRSEMRKRLLERFAEPTRHLEAFLGRELRQWYV